MKTLGELRATDQVRRLLRNHELLPNRVRPARIGVSPPDTLSANDHADWRNYLFFAEKVGAIEIVRGTRNQSDAIQRIRIRDADALARKVLGLLPAPERAAQTARVAREVCGGLQVLLGVVDEAVSVWRLGKAWEGISPEPEQAAGDFACAAALLRGDSAGLDRRTASLTMTGASKYLDRRGGSVAGILRCALDMPSDLPRNDVFERMGLSGFLQPVCLRAPAEIGGIPCDRHPLIGLSQEALSEVKPSGRPGYILSIENFASFNRHVREISDGAAVLYTGGFPSRAARTAAGMLAAAWPEAPIVHWGDIDAGGLLIAQAMEEAFARPIRPHLMSSALESSHWRSSPPLTRLCGMTERDDEWGVLARFLTSTEARTLEQEAIDPQPFRLGDR